MKIRPLVRWSVWLVGVVWDPRLRRLDVLLLPMLGVRFEFRRRGAEPPSPPGPWTWPTWAPDLRDALTAGALLLVLFGGNTMFYGAGTAAAGLLLFYVVNRFTFRIRRD